MFSLKDYDIPIDLLVHVILKFVSYFDLDSVLPCFRLTPKEIANIKYKIYNRRLKMTKQPYAIEFNIENKLHHEDGPARIWEDGDIEWHREGALHREDGPALEYSNGTKQWYMHDKLHREDGPAIEWANGHKEWWLNGVQVTKF